MKRSKEEITRELVYRAQHGDVKAMRTLFKDREWVKKAKERLLLQFRGPARNAGDTE